MSQQTLAPLRAAYTTLRQEAADLITAREDAWSPVAVQLADLVHKAEVATEAEPKLTVATEALKWLQANAGELRNQRIAPLAEQSEGHLGGAATGKQRRSRGDPAGRPEDQLAASFWRRPSTGPTPKRSA